ncbi:MAG: DUF512 domain-containing protein [Clostridia bacterium]
MKKIVEVLNGSIANELGIEVGDYVLKLNGREPVDRLDMIFFDSKKKIKLEIKNKNGEIILFKFSKDESEKIGIELEGFDEIQTRWCANHCLFCFVDQLPKSMRKTLYVKDDDWRLSFISGNYVTLTNLSKLDIKRICTQKISPLYISVHATDEKVRNFLLGRKKSRNILKLLKKFAKNKITCHCQVVLCPNINDGKILAKTMKDLFKLYPFVKSLAIVPVGLSGHRNKLTKIEPFTKDGAKMALAQIQEFVSLCKKKTGDDFVFPADELFLKAGMELPDAIEYGEFEQLENGVGLVAKFAKDFKDALSLLPDKVESHSYNIATGVSAFDLISKCANMFMEKHANVKINVIKIINKYFGETITVAGLITAVDLFLQAKDKLIEGELLITKSMLKETENVFLDGTTLEELEKKLNRKIIVSGAGGEDFAKTLAGKGESI